LVAVSTLSASALADGECGRPDLEDTFPPENAVNVPTNATLTAHYAQTAEYSGEVVTLDQKGGADQTLDATFDDSQGLLQATPGSLSPGADYVVSWPALKGVGTASLGSSAKIAFTAGSGPDTETPSFTGLANLDWDVARRHDACTGSTEERFVFDVTPGPAEDDFGLDELALVVFQTRGPGIGPSDPPVQVAVKPLPVRGDSVRVERSIGDASGEVCFAALVRDLVGHMSAGADKVLCAKTTAPPFFYGCRFTPTTPGDTGGGAAATALLLSFLARRRHRRAS
jgi:hypothetical protein